MIRLSPFITHTHSRKVLSRIVLFSILIFTTSTIANSQSCDYLDLESEEVAFILDGYYYKDGSTAIICESSLPLPIELIKRGFGGNVTIDVKWIRGVDENSMNPSTTSITHFSKQGSFLGRKYMTNRIEASIVGVKEVYNFTIQLIEDCSLMVSKSQSVAGYGVDGNYIEGYPTYNPDPKLNKPYKWIPTGGSDEVVLKIKPSNTSIKNHLDIHTPEKNVTADPILDPVGDLTQHTLNHLSGSGNDYDKVHICNHYAYNLVSDDTKTLDVHLYIVTESDDDYINYCNNNPYLKADCMTALTEYDSCINPGPDGSLDLYFDVNRYRNPAAIHVYDTNLLPIPLYVENSDERHTLEVRPIRIESTNTYLCNIKESFLMVSNPKIPAVSNSKKNQIISDLNEVYNQVGIDVTVNFSNISYNFDSINEDDVLEDLELDLLQSWLISQNPHLANSEGVFNITTGWIVYGNNNGASEGEATDIGMNTFSINNSNHERRAFAHEIGHAKYSLQHPDGINWEVEGLLNSQMLDDFDQENFMLSGENGTSPEKAFIIRPYHWKLIHQNH